MTLLRTVIIPLMVGLFFLAFMVWALLRSSSPNHPEHFVLALFLFGFCLVTLVIIPLPNPVVRVSTLLMIGLAGALSLFIAIRGGLAWSAVLTETSLFSRLWGVVGAVLILVLSVVALWPTPPGVALGLPVEDGVWFVYQGGPLSLVNHHMGVPEQRYGLDIVLAPTSLGSTLRLGRSPESHPTWNATVVAPAHGTVITAVDGFPDLDVGIRDRRNLAGNHVELLTEEGVRILIAHLQQGSVEVTEGQKVARGDALGRVGNSGNTTEPHIHIHAMTETTDGTWVGIPMYFDGHSPRRGHLLRPGN